MLYRIEFRPEVEKDLQGMDKAIMMRIFRKIKWLSENFDYISPEVLKGDWKGKYKLRIGDYRVIYNVNHSTYLITIHLIGHRSKIYKSKGSGF